MLANQRPRFGPPPCLGSRHYCATPPFDWRGPRSISPIPVLSPVTGENPFTVCIIRSCPDADFSPLSRLEVSVYECASWDILVRVGRISVGTLPFPRFAKLSGLRVQCDINPEVLKFLESSNGVRAIFDRARACFRFLRKLVTSHEQVRSSSKTVRMPSRLSFSCFGLGGRRIIAYVSH